MAFGLVDHSILRNFHIHHFAISGLIAWTDFVPVRLIKPRLFPYVAETHLPGDSGVVSLRALHLVQHYSQSTCSPLVTSFKNMMSNSTFTPMTHNCIYPAPDPQGTSFIDSNPVLMAFAGEWHQMTLMTQT